MMTQGTTRWLAATAVAAVVGWGGAATAASINISAVNFANGNDAFNALQAFRGGQKDYVAEDFEGFSAGDLTENGSGTLSTGESALETSVGRFGKGSGALDGTGACGGGLSDCTSPGILDQPNSPFNGRFNSTPGGANWLDSNDVSQVVWEADLQADGIDLGNGQKISGLGVILTDVTDVGATFQLELEGGMMTASETFAGLGNGDFTLVTASFNFKPPITSFRATFENISGNQTSDGFGIDDATVTVPVPATLGLLGIGLIGLGAAARRRRNV